MKLLRNSLLLIVIFGGYLLLSVPSTTQGFWVMHAGNANIVGQDRFDKTRNILIKKVHEPQWRVLYNFTFGCADAFEEDKLKAVMTKALQAWLQPLREFYPDRDFTDDFIFVRIPDVKECDHGLGKLPNQDVYITFDCKGDGNSLAFMGGWPPGVCIKRPVFNEGVFYDLLHELGHAFGMVDTYVKRCCPSTGGLNRTTGKQPSSIMASTSGGVVALAEDDKNGIIWFYRYFYEDQPVEDCFFPDYHYVERFNGFGTCEPRYPLIYEVRYRSDRLVSDILRQDPELELNGRDASKMTALHHAVLRSRIEVVKLLLRKRNINANITNGDGLTPAQLARQLGQMVFYLQSR